MIAIIQVLDRTPLLLPNPTRSDWYWNHLESLVLLRKNDKVPHLLQFNTGHVKATRSRTELSIVHCFSYLVLRVKPFLRLSFFRFRSHRQPQFARGLSTLGLFKEKINLDSAEQARWFQRNKLHWGGPLTERRARLRLFHINVFPCLLLTFGSFEFVCRVVM